MLHFTERRFVVMRMALIITTIAVHSAAATIYHVAPNGADANPGTEAKPFRTIQKAADIAAPGDKVMIRAGAYAESVTIKNSGGSGRPIVFQGERGPKGEWLTRLDPSVSVTARWVPAPEVGNGVYKMPFPSFEPFLMLVDGKFVPRIWPDRMKDGLGFKKLAYPPDQRVVVYSAGATKAPGKGGILAGTGTEVDPTGRKTVAYWDTVGAMYGCKDGMIYLRFRDRDDPNTKAICIAPQGGGVQIRGSWIVIRDLFIQGGQQGVAIRGPNADHNVVENCRLVNAAERISVEHASHTVIRNNDVTAEFYSDKCLTGAWGDDASVPDITDELGRKYHFYVEYKMFFGPRGTSDYGIRLTGGANNEIAGNRVFKGGQGIHLSRTTNARVHGNTVTGMSSIGIIPTMDGIADVHIHDNLICDCNIAIRIHHVNERRQTAPRSLYVYRNLVWQKPGVGTGIFFHFHDKNDMDPYPHPFIAIYHNTFAGGVSGLYPNAHADRMGGLPHTLVVNNIFSTRRPVYTSSRFRQRKGAWSFDHNWLGGSGKFDAVWFGPRNVDAAGKLLWDTAQEPRPVLPTDSTARTAGLDLSKPFTLDGKTHNPLPGMKPGYFTGRAPDLGAYANSATATP